MREKLFSPKYVSLYKECSQLQIHQQQKSSHVGAVLSSLVQHRSAIGLMLMEKMWGRRDMTRKGNSREGKIKQDNTIKVTMGEIRVKFKSSVFSCVQTDLPLRL